MPRLHALSHTAIACSYSSKLRFRPRFGFGRRADARCWSGVARRAAVASMPVAATDARAAALSAAARVVDVQLGWSKVLLLGAAK